MNKMMRRGLCCALSIALLGLCVGCADSTHGTSGTGGDSTRSSETDDAAVQAHRAFTVDALDDYASDNLFDDKTDPVLVKKLGSKVVHGDGMIPFKEPIDGDNSYEVAFMCKGEEQTPFSFVLYKDGQPHTMSTMGGCASDGVQSVSLPAKRFPGATSLSVINIGGTDLVVSAYEVKEAER